jgi:hypothetical protein
MPEHLTFDSLSAQLHTKFRLGAVADQVLELELVGVEQHGDVAGQTGRFSAYFRGPLEHFLPQSTYQLEHEGLGGVEIFIVPVRKDGEGIYYEAVFNRVN